MSASLSPGCHIAHGDGHYRNRLHYIPLSNSYQEIYNIHAFFSGATEATLRAANSTTLELSLEERRPADGDRRLRRIARAGKQWRRTFGRKEDMEGELPRSPLVPCQSVEYLRSLLQYQQLTCIDCASSMRGSGQTTVKR